MVSGLGFVLTGGTTLAEERRKHEPLIRAIQELREAKQHLKRQKRHEQVEKAHRALREAIKYVDDTRGVGGERRERLTRRLRALDGQLRKDHTQAERALTEAIEDLEFALKH
jgi:hypothetical protein